MARSSSKFVPNGTLDTDSAPEWVKPGDYTDALNVTHLTNNTESTQSIVPYLGNEFSFDLGSVSVQNKTWRITTPLDATNDVGGIFLYDQQGNLFPTIGAQAQPMEWNRNQSLALQTAAILAMFTTIDGNGNTSVTTIGDYIYITTDTINGYDIGLDATTSTGATPTVSDTTLSPTIIQEAYDNTLTGELSTIGSYDLLGELYILSTPQTHLPEGIIPGIINVARVAAATTPPAFEYLVTTDINHGLSTGDKIVTSQIDYTGGVNTIDPNGIWIIEVVSPTSFNLKEWYNIDPANAFVFGSGGLITLYTEAVGEIGVAQKNFDTNAWTYTRLLRTKEWNFRTEKQADFRVGQRTNIKDSVYWTDDYNVPRCFYYSHPYVTDGGLEINGGRYEYGSIAQESQLILSTTDTAIAFVSQTQAGGQIKSGNWRYAIRFLSDSISATDWSDLTNPINVCSASLNGVPTLIIGDEPGYTTPKINVFEVTGIIPGLYKYIELAGVNYVGDGIEGYVIKRVLLDDVSETLTIDHTGTETDVTNLDLGTLSMKSTPVVTAKSMDVIDSRMILSNITIAQQSDLTAWAQTFKHYLFQQSIDSVRTATLGTIQMGEYQDPQNVNNYVGYMHNETYRFGVKVRFKNTGFISDIFHVDDVIFDTEATNSASTNPTRRLGGLNDFNLSDSTGGPSPSFDTTTVYVPYIRFTDIDLDFLVDGIPVRDLIDSFTIERAEVLNPTILADGYAIPSIEAVNVDSPNYGFTYNGNITYFPVLPNGASNGIGEFPFISGKDIAPANPVFDPLAGTTGFGADDTIFAFYSPDVQFGHTSITFASGDKMINYGNPIGPNFTAMSGGGNVSSQYGQWSGKLNTSGANPGITTTHDVDEAYFVEKGDDVVIHTLTYKKYGALFNNNSIYSICDINSSMVVGTTTSMVDFATQTNYGFLRCQYYRPLTSQYGDTATTKYVSCGNLFTITNAAIGLQSINVFGGDVFTQLNYFRHRFYSVGGEDFSGSGFNPWTTAVDGFGGGLSFYSQNRVNAQMKQKSASQTGPLYPGISTLSWIETLTDTDGTQGEAYQEGYTIRNQVKSEIAYDSALERTNDLPGRIVWSELKPQDSAQDNFRVYLPLNFKDLNSADGEIVHHASINGELFTWQLRRFMKQFFNTRGTLETSVTEVVIGDGSVMSRDGVTISLIGTKHKWSIIKGKSTGGNDVFYWINTELKKAVRFGYDGTVSIGDIKGMQSFLANNLVWVDDKDTPADGQGICGVWHDRFAEAIWTIRGVRDIDLWSVAEDYAIGAVVSYQPSTYTTFEQTGEIFISKTNPNLNIIPVAVYPVSNTIVTLTGTTTLTLTMGSPHLLVDGDEVIFTGITGLSIDINDVAHVVTVTGANTFTILVALLVNAYDASSGIISETTSKYWEVVLHTNNEYYNEYTLIYNEFKNGFTTFATHKPKIYLKWTDTYLSPRPVSTVSRIYEHNKGDYLTWYDESSVSQTERGFIEGIVNAANDQAKTFVSIAVDSASTPNEVTFTTNTQESYLDSSEFETNEESSYSDIKADSTITVDNPTGLNNTDASLLAGRWIKTKFYFAVAAYNSYLNTLIEFMINYPFKSK